MAAENPDKIDIIQNILQSYPDNRVLIIGEYITQLQKIADALEFHTITGKTPPEKREELYRLFRQGKIQHLILSRVGNFALDLPDADVLIQVSGMFGSRQEEAQRLGRILRPKKDGRQARFFTLISQHSVNKELGVLTWGNEVDIAPETLYAETMNSPLPDWMTPKHISPENISIQQRQF